MWLFFTVWKVIHEERKITNLPVYPVRMKRHNIIRKPDFEKRLEGVSGAGFNLGILSYCKITKEFYFPMLSFWAKYITLSHFLLCS